MRRCAGYDEVFQIGIGKSGTTTVKTFFDDRYDYNSTCGNELAEWIQAEANKHRPLLKDARIRCPHFYAGDLMRVYFANENTALQLTHLHNLRVEAQNALFVHCARNTTKWLSSVSRWNTLKQRITQRDLPGLPRGVGAKPQELREWYDEVNAYLAFTFKYRLNYVRVNVDNPASLDALVKFCDPLALPHVWTAKNANPAPPIG